MRINAGIKERNFLTTSVRSVDAENFRITHVVNTKALDRYMTIVLPKGADVKHYTKNPVVLWLHNMDKSTMQVPIGRCVDLQVGEDEIVCTTEFNPNDALSMKVFNAYKDGFLNAWSIGFMPKTFEEVTPVNFEELKKKYNLNVTITQKQFEDNAFWGIWIISEWEMLEYSAVPVPGNPEALSDAEVEKFSRELVTRGILEDEETRRINFRDLLKKDEARRKAECKCEDKENCTCKKTEEKPAEEKKAEAAPETPKAEEKSVEPAPAEAKAEETKAAESTSTVSTADAGKEPEPVAGKPEDALRAELDAVKAENAALKGQLGELNQKNCELSERMAKLETRMAANEATSEEVKTLKAEMVEVRKSVEVDNIDTVRQVAQQKAKGGNADSFFSNLISRK
jgi:uncharacterized coiled-coil protein SlyX